MSKQKAAEEYPKRRWDQERIHSLSVYHLSDEHKGKEKIQTRTKEIAQPSYVERRSERGNAPIVVRCQSNCRIQTLLQISLVSIRLEQLLPCLGRELRVETALVGVFGFFFVVETKGEVP